jgi:hypothetical protein
MRYGVILIVSVVLFSFLISSIILTVPSGQCDIAPEPNYSWGIVVQGAHIVSEGAYFRFWIRNPLANPINVTINDADTLTIASKSSIDYDVVAPRVWMLYQKVIYRFRFSYAQNVEYQPHGVHYELDFPVVVLSSGFVQIFDLIIPILVIVTIAIVTIISIVILRRRRARRRTQH